jgi:hypothetical protein
VEHSPSKAANDLKPDDSNPTIDQSSEIIEISDDSEDEEWDGIPDSDAEDTDVQQLYHSDKEATNSAETQEVQDSTTDLNRQDLADNHDTAHAEAETPDSTIHTLGATLEDRSCSSEVTELTSNDD